ncbi:protein ENL isoform 2-T2 [Geothlypis trichas]|uniref:MLLT1 super elongation complex subunit n=2 Tax=Passeriformes TaxID=9126 RepID=A0A8C9MGK0_SERCA|nr:protein ENL [Serinus canaria]XP_030822530.1 protein ENL isoform X2 [Camarhynchus parvulus]XP_054147174.1 protein ENL isoform X2 [Melozone crissalis]XP_054506257.1 protein ENL [Agelaius phoeniceus]XP_058677227.1 protein ENL isoform X2 [Ammospiza caudacuta]XP_059345675.1 protein ENL isoform X2 [Ammospiza nelsoni]XP_059726058.1 protein ENL isoform X2 [Haemorhous mexicanus]
MDNQCTVQVKLELGHRAQLRKKPTTEGFTHDWMVFVRGPEQCDIQHFVERVVFRLHESFPKPKRVCKEPPYKVEESGYAGFIMPIEVHFKNKEEPKKVCFTYDLFLNLEGNPPVNHLRCEKLTFNNPTKEFRRKLIRAGGVMVMPEGAETVSRPSPDYPMLPTIPLSAFSDPKKTKPSHGSKDANKESSKASKPHKVTKEHRERPRKDSESKNSSKDLEREQNKPLKDSSRKPTENKLPKEEKAPPKAAFKEPKLAVKETKLENTSPKGGPQPELKSSSKRPSNVESPKPSAKKQKKSSSKGVKNILGTSPRTSSSSYPEKKQTKEKMNAKVEKVKSESEAKEIKKPVEMEESNSEDETSFKSESVQSSPSNSSSSSDSSSDSDFEPSQNHSQGPLRSMVEDLQSEESDDDDSSSGEEAAVKTNPVSRDSRLSLSDSDSDNSADSCPPSREPPPGQKLPPANNKASGRKSPESCNKPEKILKKGTYDKAYTDELVELHRRLMALRERNVLQQIVNLIEETGHFNVTNTTFDFDLFSLDETTVRKLQSYLEAVAT